ncbi:MAG: hypothetical protein K2N87_04510 [Eubacterium sp.]|nr:hypothetical protein [Eubacterium sp.]
MTSLLPDLNSWNKLLCQFQVVVTVPLLLIFVFNRHTDEPMVPLEIPGILTVAVTEASISAGEELLETERDIFKLGFEKVQRAPKYSKFLPLEIFHCEPDFDKLNS